MSAQLGEKFDVVIFMGVLYHFRHPLLALDLLHDTSREDLLIFQSMQRGSDEAGPVEDGLSVLGNRRFRTARLSRDVLRRASVFGRSDELVDPQSRLRRSHAAERGFDIIAHPEEEVYICRPRSSQRAAVSEQTRYTNLCKTNLGLHG